VPVVQGVLFGVLTDKILKIFGRRAIEEIEK
jgi:hypothetical protein